jgi:hypothetical protein
MYTGMHTCTHVTCTTPCTDGGGFQNVAFLLLSNWTMLYAYDTCVHDEHIICTMYSLYTHMCMHTCMHK